MVKISAPIRGEGQRGIQRQLDQVAGFFVRAGAVAVFGVRSRAAVAAFGAAWLQVVPVQVMRSPTAQTGWPVGLDRPVLQCS